MLTVTGGLAEFDRELTGVRAAGARARANGVRLGHRPKLTPHERREAIRRRDAGEPVREIARCYNVHGSMISRLAA